jgi:hypothetical protein
MPDLRQMVNPDAAAILDARRWRQAPERSGLKEAERPDQACRQKYRQTTSLGRDSPR